MAKVAVDASISEMCKAGVDLPVMLSVTITDLSGRTLSGQLLMPFLLRFLLTPIFSIGLNCFVWCRADASISERIISKSSLLYKYLS